MYVSLYYSSLLLVLIYIYSSGAAGVYNIQEKKKRVLMLYAYSDELNRPNVESVYLPNS